MHRPIFDPRVSRGLTVLAGSCLLLAAVVGGATAHPTADVAVTSAAVDQGSWMDERTLDFEPAALEEDVDEPAAEDVDEPAAAEEHEVDDVDEPAAEDVDEPEDVDAPEVDDVDEPEDDDADEDADDEDEDADEDEAEDSDDESDDDSEDDD